MINNLEMAERYRPPFAFPRGARCAGPRPNVTNSPIPRRPLLCTPPAVVPPRFPPPRGNEPLYGAYQEDPRQFAPNTFARCPPFPPRPGIELARARFPCPERFCSQSPVLSGIRPRPDYRPPPTTPVSGEMLRLRCQQGPGFRAARPLNFAEDSAQKSLNRGELPRPGFVPDNCQRPTLRAEERFSHPRQSFTPYDSFSAATRGPRPQDRAFQFPHPPVEHPTEELEPRSGPFRIRTFPDEQYKSQEGNSKYHAEEWSWWPEDGNSGRNENWSNQNQHEMGRIVSHSERVPETELMYGNSEAVHHGRIRYVGRNLLIKSPPENLREERPEEVKQPPAAQVKRPESVLRDDRPTRNGSRDFEWSEMGVGLSDKKFQPPESVYFAQQQQPSEQGHRKWHESSEDSGRPRRENGRKPYESRRGIESDSGGTARHENYATMRTIAHLDEASYLPGKHDKPMTDGNPKDRSLSNREQRTVRSRMVRDKQINEVPEIEKSESRRRHSSELKSGSAARLSLRDSYNESRSTADRHERRSRRPSYPMERKHGSKSSKEDGDLGNTPGRSGSSRHSSRTRRETESLSGSRRSRHHSHRTGADSDSGRRERSRYRHCQTSPSPAKRLGQDSSVLAITDANPRVADDKMAEKENEEAVEEEERIPDWIRCSPADLYFKRDKTTVTLISTPRMQELERKVEYELLNRADRLKESRPQVEMPPRNQCGGPDRMSDEESMSNMSLSEIEDLVAGDEEEEEEEEGENKKNENEEQDNAWMEELNWKRNHPERLHDEMWFNLPGEMNDGPLCRCSSKSKGQGIRHNIYPGEEPIRNCDPNSNNQEKLFHYRITMSPHTNFLTKNPTLVEYDNHEYIFEGFSLFSHYKIGKIPLCKVIRFNIEYTIHWFEEEMIENFDVRSLDLFADFLYHEILELIDLDWAGRTQPDRCRPFHIMPRFARDLPDNGKEILSMNEVLNFLLRSCRALLEETELANMLTLDENEWQNVVDEVRGMIVTYPGMRPSSLRIDQLDREQKDPDVITYPKIIHFGLRPAQLSYAGDPKYKKLWKHYMKLKHLIANKPKTSVNDREKMRTIEDQLQEIRLKGSMKREMTVEISSEGFLRTGIKSDICQHALLLPVLVQHLRFHRCLDALEKNIKYQFKDRLYLELALTHPSYRTNYGTNPDHARNSLTNCGFRQLEYGDRQIHYVHRRKRGINVLMHIMSKLAKDHETPSEIHHYERLEFLGDSVIEFLSSIHLFFMFPRLEEGGLATYRAALVQNQFLTVLAEKIGLHHYMLYAHGPDLCRDLDLRYAMANCFEALMGSLFLDGGVEVVDRVYSEALFKDEPELLNVWTNLPRHPLQEDEPNGDRHWIPLSPPLQKFTEFEKMTGIIFNHIRLLARAFTMRNIGYNNLTLGHNQTLEFLGDTILQFISSEFLFKHFPDHHEGHLTLLRTSLVNHRTQATICDDLGMTEYVINNDQKVRERMENEKNKVKDKADILEAFLGALYVDQGLESCKVLTEVCFYPRLQEFIMNQDWNDAKSQLQQCCLTLRDPSDGDPDIPIYKVLQCTGPTNTRKYHVAVYFRGDRLGTGIGHSIQRAEMNAAANALKEKQYMFPHLLHVQHFLDRRFGKRRKRTRDQLKNPSHHRHHHNSAASQTDKRILSPSLHHHRRPSKVSSPRRSSAQHKRSRSSEKIASSK